MWAAIHSITMVRYITKCYKLLVLILATWIVLQKQLDANLSGINEVYKLGISHLDGLTIHVVHHQLETEEVALPQVGWWLLVKLHNILVVPQADSAAQEQSVSATWWVTAYVWPGISISHSVVITPSHAVLVPPMHCVIKDILCIVQ